MPYRLPPLTALRAYEVAARHRSFKSAAEELFVTPAAVSQQIKVLEDYLGIALFVRQVRAVNLTPEGEAMLPKLQEGFACLAAAVEAVRAWEQDGALVVRTPPAFASRWLIPRLARFTERYPDIALRLSGSEQNIDDNPQASAGEPVDPRSASSEISIRYGSGRYPVHRVTEIFAPVLVPACSPALLQGEHPLREPADLRWHTLVHEDAPSPQSDRPTWADWLREAGVEGIDAEKGPRFGNNLAIEAAIDGLGVVLVLKPLVAEAVAGGRLVVPFDVTVRLGNAYYLVVPETIAERPAVRAFSDWLIAEAEACRE